MNNLADLLLRRGVVDEARELTRKVLDIQLQSRDLSDPEVLVTRLTLAQTMIAAADIDAALDHIERTMTLYRNNAKASDMDKALAKAIQGYAFIRSDRLGEGHGLLENSYTRLVALHSGYQFQVRDYLEELAEIYTQSGQLELAETINGLLSSKK